MLDFLSPDEISKIAPKHRHFVSRPWRLKYVTSLISFKIGKYTFEKCAETPSRRAISCCSNIPDLKKDILYHLLPIIGQWYNKDINGGFILSNRNKRSESENHWRILTGVYTSTDFQIEFFRGLQISGKIFSRRYELARDSRESILGVFVCKFSLLVFSGGNSLLFFVFSLHFC